MMKLALVHDWLNQVGGAEDVLLALNTMYPESPIFTSIYAPDKMPQVYKTLDIRTLWIDKLPSVHTHHQRFLPAYPLAWGGLDLSDYDVILSNKSGFCHMLKNGDALHICYCLAPTRYVWQLDAYIAREGMNKATELVLRPLVALLKQWDYNGAQRVNRFIAISTEIQERIKTYYNRDSEIIFPPVETARFVPLERNPQEDDYFLIVSRLIPYKRIDLAVQAATRLGVKLKIGGSGRDLDRLKSMAGDTVEFLGFVPDDELPSLMAKCKVFLFPGLEDFGITPVQAQATSRPVIAYRGGGALDTVIEGVTGEFFDEFTVESLMHVMANFDENRYNPHTLRQHALKFDVEVFKNTLNAYIETALQSHRLSKKERA